jgi:LacI family transcriptional regulator
MVQREQRPSGRGDNVTMKAIAEEAGVTLTTVSRILNNKDNKYKYAQKTKDRIFQIANRLKYRPNALVLGMQTGRTGTAGVMVPVEGFYSLVVAGIHAEFIDSDTIMLLSWNNRSVNNREEKLERQIIHQMVDRRVQGIILRPSSEDFELSYFEEIWERKIPLILIDRHLSNIDTDFVGTDDVLAGRTAAEYLIGLGHRNLLFAGMGTITSTSRDRENGFRSVLSETPNASGRSLVYDENTFCQDLIEIVRCTYAPTAIFCYNDDMARKGAMYLSEAGFSIPHAISIMGCGNVPVTDSQLALTTFEQHPFEIGISAARMFLERIREKEKNGVRDRVIKPNLVVRGSTGPAPR